MRKHIFMGGLLILLAMILNPAGVSGQDKAAGGIAVSISGINADLLKTVAPAEVPNASTVCAINVLKVSEAKGADGKPLPGLTGQLLYYLPTKTAETVLLGTKMQGAKITVIGTLFVEAHALLVGKIETGQAGNAPEYEFEDMKAPKGTGIQAL